VAELVSSGEPVLVLCADASRRRLLAERAADPRRFGCGRAALACCRCSEVALEGATASVLEAGSGLALADWGALRRDPALVARFPHVVLVDPPPFAHLEAVARTGAGGYLHVAWGEAERAFALRVHAAEWDLRPSLGSLYQALRDAETARGPVLIELLAGPGEHPRTPERAGRCVRVLEELRLVAWEESRGDPALRVVSSEGTELERSDAFVAYRARYEEGRRFLSRPRQRP
jgi:hypothetical protein